MNLNGEDECYYIRNGQGDIIGLFDGNGSQVVSYIYDSWGKLVSTTGSLASTVGVKNPYRYRGYRFDSETGLYYLQSRYYNAEWGRFVNADSLGGEVGELLSHNIFAYCGNNPIVREDPSGNAWWVIGAIAGAIVGGIAGAAYSYYTTGSVNWKYVAGGAVGGALVGAGLGYLAETAYGGIAGVATTASTSTIDKFVEKTSNTGRSIASNVANSSRLKTQLTYQEASSVFTKSGTLHPEVVNKSHKIIAGSKLKNLNVTKALTNDGSSIKNWAKMTTQTFKSPSGNFQVHFYQNLETKVISIFEMKVKFNR